MQYLSGRGLTFDPISRACLLWRTLSDGKMALSTRYVIILSPSMPVLVFLASRRRIIRFKIRTASFWNTVQNKRHLNSHQNF